MNIQTANWRKSTYSGDPTIGTCVELADLGATVGVRDSKDKTGPVLTFSRQALAELINGLKVS